MSGSELLQDSHVSRPWREDSSRRSLLAPGLQWGTWDKDSDLISFPNFQSIEAALKDIARWILVSMSHECQRGLTNIPMTKKHPEDPSYFLIDARTVSSLKFVTEVSRNGVVSHQVRATARDHGLYQNHFFITTIIEHSDGSVVFPNQLMYRSDVLRFTDIVQLVYPLTYPAKKVDLSTFLMGTLDRDPKTKDNPVSRFFKHTLCERQVLNIVKKF